MTRPRLAALERLVTALALTTVAFGDGMLEAANPSRTVTPSATRLARGRYLVEGPLQCLDCHSDQRLDARPIRIVAGRKGAGHIDPVNPVTGVQVVAPNITSDGQTGIGGWTDAEVARAVRQGIGRDGKTLYRRMPYASFNRLSDAEPDRSTPERRGAYLVTIAHCVNCHSPGAGGKFTPGLEFSGGVTFTLNRSLEEHAGPTLVSANITPDASGISYYDASTFIKTMRSGAVNGVRPLDTNMPWSYFRNMTDGDLRDMFAYLQTLRPVQHRVDNREPATLCPLDGNRHGMGSYNRRTVATTR